MKIYTRAGDQGNTRLFDGSCLCKHGIVFTVMGELDELSVALGHVIVDNDLKNNLVIFEDDKEVVYLDTFCRNLQTRLLDINSVVARANVTLDDEFVTDMEHMIDFMTDKMPKLREFILPGVGSGKDLFLHHCRVICRRAERSFQLFYSLSDDNNDNFSIISKILNRLSDLFFTLARYVMHLEGQEDVKRC